MGTREVRTVCTPHLAWDRLPSLTMAAPIAKPLQQVQRDLLCSQAAQVIALADQGFAFLKEVVGDRGASVQGLELLAELVQVRADVQEHKQDPPVRGVVAVMLHVALHLQSPV